jgi:hypothetical protein
VVCPYNGIPYQRHFVVREVDSHLSVVARPPRVADASRSRSIWHLGFSDRGSLPVIIVIAPVFVLRRVSSPEVWTGA